MAYPALTFARILIATSDGVMLMDELDDASGSPTISPRSGPPSSSRSRPSVVPVRTVTVVHSPQPVDPGGGWMPSSCTIVGASSRNTGAAAVPPKRSLV